MVPGQILHRLAGWLCDRDALEQVVEPLLADLQYQWRQAGTRSARTWILTRGYAAYWQTLPICGARRILHEAVSTLARAGFDQFLLALYAVPVLFVLLFAPEWVRTGSITVQGGLHMLARYLNGAPWCIWYSVRPRLVRSAAVGRLLVVCGVFLALALWLNPGMRLNVAAINVALLALYPVLTRAQRARA